MVGVSERLEKLDENWEALDSNTNDVDVDTDMVKAGPGLAKNVNHAYVKLNGNNKA